MEKYISSRILSPREYSGSMNGDFGYELNGKKSERGYISRQAAKQALERAINKLESN